MLDLIWNLFQDEDFDRLRAERRQQDAQSDELSVLNTAIVCPYCGTRRKSENVFDTA